jgi:hypothetical protein
MWIFHVDNFTIKIGLKVYTLSSYIQLKYNSLGYVQPYEELHNLYSSPSIIRIITLRNMRRAGHVALMREKRNVYRLLVGKPEGKRPLGRPIDNIKMNLFRDRIECCGLDWFGSE